MNNDLKLYFSTQKVKKTRLIAVAKKMCSNHRI